MAPPRAGQLRIQVRDPPRRNLACFARPGVVLALTSRDEGDQNRAILQDDLARLRSKNRRQAKGRTLEAIEIEQPAARHHADGRQLPRGRRRDHADVRRPEDEPAHKAITTAFPDRRVHQPCAADLIYGGGIRCITKRQPAVTAPETGPREPV